MGKLSIICFFILILISCKREQEKKVINLNTLKSEKAEGYVVPKDSMAEPVVTCIDKNKLKKIAFTKPYKVEIKSNIHPIVKPKSKLSVHPKIISLKKECLIIKKIHFSKSSVFIAGTPEVVNAKEAFTKYQNPQNFSSFSKLQGLKQQSIFCMEEDQYGNLWFGTNGGGVSKFDGKLFSHYTDREGLSNNEIRCILRDKKENLWFVTFGKGVCKFDGKFFTRFTTDEGLSHNQVLSILEDKVGNIWFGTNGGGVCKYDGEFITQYNENTGLSNNLILSMLEDKAGNIWFGTFGGGVCKFDGSIFTHFTVKDGLSGNNISCMLEDKSGNLWFGTDANGLNSFDGKNFISYTVKEGLSNNIVRCLHQDYTGKIWIGTEGGGVSVFNGSYFTNFTTNEGLSGNSILSMLEDRNNTLWIGTYEGGVNKFSGKIFTNYTDKEGLSNNHIMSIFKDNEGRLWLGSNDGIVNMYDGKSFSYFNLKAGFANSKISSIVQDTKGNLWFGSLGSGVCKFDGKFFTFFATKDGLSNNYIYCMLADKKGNVWFGTYGSGICKYNGNSFTSFTTNEGLSDNNVFSIAEVSNGDIWLGCGDGMANKFDGKQFTHYIINKGIQHNVVRSVMEDKNRNIWFGTYGGGLSKYDGKYFTHFTVKEGLSSNNILSSIEDKNGNLWFGTSLGLSKLTKTMYARIEDSVMLNSLSESAVIFKSYTHEDGFLGVGVNTGTSICEDKNGIIWIAANDRLTAFHPEGECSDTFPPGIQLNNIDLFNEKINWAQLENKKDTIIVLGNGVKVGNFVFNNISKWNSIPEGLSLAYDNNFLTFRFIGITQKSPNKVQYRYKLEGIDENWNSLSDITEAHYGNLPSGDFTFKVKAINSDGYWSKELSYSFNIRPPWWKTWWAYSLYIILVVAGILLYINLRLRNLKKRQKILEKTVKERTAELELQKKRSDELLLNILPSEVAEELKQKGSAKARQFDNVTVMFTDFKNFTAITEKLTPAELVAEIHNYFKVFDNIIDKYNIEKIKTIGDSYMCASGLTSSANKATVNDMVNAAIEIRQYISEHFQNKKAKGKEPFEIRIGIHTGPVVAGIVGIKKFAYDIWGDTVNIASRMESSGEVGKINISSTTFELVKENFTCTYRGKIEAKNKGMIDMYFVEYAN
ncbi:MAG: triple tyrosine motif-containing protein [Bacteroidetes bacterium]|nr:triple tyrosine motif-containing protein [Bacteroidota bacterium]